MWARARGKHPSGNPCPPRPAGLIAFGSGPPGSPRLEAGARDQGRRWTARRLSLGRMALAGGTDCREADSSGEPGDAGGTLKEGDEKPTWHRRRVTASVMSPVPACEKPHMPLERRFADELEVRGAIDRRTNPGAMKTDARADHLQEWRAVGFLRRPQQDARSCADGRTPSAQRSPPTPGSCLMRRANSKSSSVIPPASCVVRSITTRL